jgi:hypothetical protein
MNEMKTMNTTENNDNEPVHAEIVNDYALRPGTSDDTPPNGYRTTYEINGQTIQMPDVRPVEPRAVIAMTLAVLSWFILPVIGSIPAIWYGITAKQHIRWSDGRYTGNGLASLAISVAIANLVAVFIVILLLIRIVSAIF